MPYIHIYVYIHIYTYTYTLGKWHGQEIPFRRTGMGECSMMGNAGETSCMYLCLEPSEWGPSIHWAAVAMVHVWKLSLPLADEGISFARGFPFLFIF